MNPLKSIYIAGPMSGIPQFNIPLFNKARGIVQLLYPEAKIICPHDSLTQHQLAIALDNFQGTAHSKPYLDCLADDISLILRSNVENIVLLPGWLGSKGAKIEANIAYILGWQAYRFWPDSNHLEPMSIVASIAAATQFRPLLSPGV